ncbi:hypothetical protein BwSH20_62580 [Bradyrhizobium ottawaense]|nr:hypothetical protein SG09_62330 [Bradyrhizobium ottawaense]BBO12000.1 hypothetical protein TM102_34700 [Bradyrhizobium sp. TM102]GMO21200.1 hypothetical protein BwSF12_12170 [Bradyrhizobium ottawaense]GMO47065.1 hypothetical protein BwSF21_64110 [Bradyrhizobium ottawaense]GMO52969.1 hypothetical protein BwSH14_76030 [Bradyrhizobium ottawaense]
MGADDMMEARLIRAVFRLPIRKLQDGSQPGRTRTVPVPQAVGIDRNGRAPYQRAVDFPNT